MITIRLCCIRVSVGLRLQGSPCGFKMRAAGREFVWHGCGAFYSVSQNVPCYSIGVDRPYIVRLVRLSRYEESHDGRAVYFSEESPELARFYETSSTIMLRSERPQQRVLLQELFAVTRHVFYIYHVCHDHS